MGLFSRKRLPEPGVLNPEEVPIPPLPPSNFDFTAEPAPLANQAPMPQEFFQPVDTRQAAPAQPQPVTQQAQPQAEEGKPFDLPDFEDAEIRQLSRPKPVEQPKAPEPKPAPPKPELPVIEAVVEQPRLIDVRKCFEIKDLLSDLKGQVKKTEEVVEQFSNLQKTHKYSELTSNLNFVQEKLMFIDSKLF